MENIVTISNIKENVLEFTIDIKGIDTDDISVSFVIEADSMDLGFDSENEKDNKWIVKIPALPFLKTTMYPFHIDVVVDGYHFTPLTGSLNVVGTQEVYASTPKNVELEPSDKPKTKQINKKEKTKKENKTQEPIIEPNKSKTKKPTTNIKPLKIEKTNLPDVKKKQEKKEINDKLNNEIVDLLKKAKEERKEKQTVDEKELKTKKETKTEKDNEKEIIKSIEKINNPSKEENKTDTSNESSNDVEKSVEEEKTNIKDKEKNKTKKDESKEAKVIAEKIIQSVTGLNKPISTEKKNNPIDEKVKQIIKSESKKDSKKSTPIEPAPIKKITKDKKIVTIDEDKEKTVKDAIKNIVDDDVTLH